MGDHVLGSDSSKCAVFGCAECVPVPQPAKKLSVTLVSRESGEMGQGFLADTCMTSTSSHRYRHRPRHNKSTKANETPNVPIGLDKRGQAYQLRCGCAIACRRGTHWFSLSCAKLFFGRCVIIGNRYRMRSLLLSVSMHDSLVRPTHEFRICMKVTSTSRTCHRRSYMLRPCM